MAMRKLLDLNYGWDIWEVQIIFFLHRIAAKSALQIGNIYNNYHFSTHGALPPFFTSV